jgi:hypothetical protein
MLDLMKTCKGKQKQDSGCADTPGWDNGAGLDCALYAQEGFCADGNVLQEWAVGTFWAFPEEACCVCGGGA